MQVNQEDSRLVPDDLSFMECIVVKEVLSRIKVWVLSGVPSGKVIDQALTEVEEVALNPASSQPVIRS